MKNRSTGGLNGIIIVDKPTGISSNGVLNRLKSLFGRQKMGFLGTLDPLATGVLPVFMGKATKLISTFEGTHKRYRASMELGRRTDTLDVDGRELSSCDAGGLDPDLVRETILSFQGEVTQRVPDYSAVKHSGVASYRLAREGKAVPAAMRTVQLWDTRIETVDLPRATFCVSCTAGTYIRTLVSDIGDRLEVGAIVTGLRRLNCGDVFPLEKAVTLEHIERITTRGEYSFLLDPGSLLTDHDPYWVGEREESQLRHGQTVSLCSADGDYRPETKLKALRSDGVLVAIGQVVRQGSGDLGFQPTRVLI